MKSLIGVIAALSLTVACGQGTDSPADPGSPVASAPAAGGDVPSEQNEAAPSMGRLTVNLVDAPTQEVTGIFVTLSSLQADLSDATTVELMSGSVTVDLLTLQNGNFLGLGSVAMPPGTIDRLRLIVDEAGQNYVTLADGSTAPLKVPSGAESGIKLDGPFSVAACANTTLTLDFDGKKSLNVHATGKTGQFLLRPVVFVKQVEVTETACETEQPTSADADGGMPEDGGMPQQTPAPADAGTPESPTDAGMPEETGSPRADAGAALPEAADAGFN